MVSIGVTMVLVLGFIGESMGLFGSGVGSGSNKPIVMLCANPKCGKSYEISRSEFQKLMQDMGPGGMMPMMQPVFKCKFCGEKSAYIAQKCEKCGAVFVPDYTDQSNEYPDTCPECGYSRL
ncbi:MAG: hypothetical protein GWO86_03390, partial [Planctomycetes bacterium]|nr:hypothetical protein [Planctomycetota bacterium]